MIKGRADRPKRCEQSMIEDIEMLLMHVLQVG